MIWDDSGFLLSKNRYNENSLISEIFTKNHGKVSGIIFGGTSKKIKNYLQIGNKIHLNFNSKTENKIGYFKIEIEQALSPLYFDNPQKLTCIISAMQLVRLLTAESQTNENIYKLINKFYSILALNNVLEKQLTKEENKILNYFEIIENINQTKLSSELIQFKKALYLIKVGKNELAKKILENLINENSILKEAAKEIITK